MSPDILHKTEFGGVVLGCDSPESLLQACLGVLDSVSRAAPEACLTGFPVQPMLRGLGEVLLGYRSDARVGGVVTLGVGGLFAEIYRDFCFRVAPVSESAHSALRKEYAKGD